MMKMLLRSIRTASKVLLSVILLCVTQLSQSQDYVWAPDFPVGSSIPEIAAEDQNGEMRTLDDLMSGSGMLFMLSRSFDW